MALHLECVPEPAQALAARLFPAIARFDFVLAGGTGLALQLGHRVSVDFDFFAAPDKFPRLLKERLAGAAGTVQIVQDKEETLDVLLDGIKCSFFSYPYPFSAFDERYHGAPLASILDIAAMKLIAVAQRGAKKDFVDLYVVLQQHGFDSVFADACRRFGPQSMNPLQIGKALVYFSDAQTEPDPLFAGPMIPWDRIENFFRAHAREYVEHMIAASR